jgi:hypothetical protein
LVVVGGKSAGGCGGNALIYVLAVALVVALIVMIVLIVVYTQRNDNTSNNDNRYVDVDILAQKSGPPVVLNGPLSEVSYDHVHPGSVKQHSGSMNATVPLPREVQTGPEQLVRTKPATMLAEGDGAAAAAAALKYKVLTPIVLETLVNSPDVHVVAVVSKHCGACSALKRVLGDMKDSSAVNVIESADVQTLPEGLKTALRAEYVPQFFKVGKHGSVVKGKTGAMSETALLAYIAE